MIWGEAGCPRGACVPRQCQLRMLRMQRTLSYRHRVISDDDVVFIGKLIAAHPGSSRRDPSKKLCQAWNWVQANGALRDMVCRGLMLMLHREGLIELPPITDLRAAVLAVCPPSHPAAACGPCALRHRHRDNERTSAPHGCYAGAA